MTTCERLSDRMVPVVGGQDRWAPADLDHLASCAECESEWRLVQRGAELGAGLPPLDTGRMAAAVRARLAAERPTPAEGLVVPIESRRSRRGLGWAIGLAAAAAIVMAVVRDRPRVDPSVPPVVATGPALTEPVLTELDDLNSTELESVLGELESGELDARVGGLDDLNSKELEQILQSWES